MIAKLERRATIKKMDSSHGHWGVKVHFTGQMFVIMSAVISGLVDIFAADDFSRCNLADLFLSVLKVYIITLCRFASIHTFHPAAYNVKL